MSRPNSEFRSALRADMVKRRREARKVVRAQTLKDRVTGQQPIWRWQRAGCVRRSERPEARKQGGGR